MKRIIFSIMLIMGIISVTTVRSLSQTPTCTHLITSPQTSDLIVDTNEVVCIVANGSVSGDITVRGGGLLYNAGVIHLREFYIMHGDFVNDGQVVLFDFNNIYLNKGALINNTSIKFDDLYIRGQNTYLENNGLMEGLDIYISLGADTFPPIDSFPYVVNNGNIISKDLYMSDSSTFINNDTITISDEFIVKEANLHNKGVIVSEEFYNRGTVINDDFLNTTDDFYNYNDFTNNSLIETDKGHFNYGTMTNNCYINVDEDLVNHGIFNGNSSSFSRVNVAGDYYNNNSVALDNSLVDICVDPIGGIFNNGTHGSNVTHCINSDCHPLVTTTEPTNTELLVYPNPATDHITIGAQGEYHIESYTLTNAIGQSIESKTFIQTSRLTFTTDHLSPGVYLISIRLATGYTLSQRVLIRR